IAGDDRSSRAGTGVRNGGLRSKLELPIIARFFSLPSQSRVSPPNFSNDQVCSVSVSPEEDFMKALFPLSAPRGLRRVWAVGRWVALGSVLPVLWACNSRTLEKPQNHPVQVYNNVFK